LVLRTIGKDVLLSECLNSSQRLLPLLINVTAYWVASTWLIQTNPPLKFAPYQRIAKANKLHGAFLLMRALQYVDLDRAGDIPFGLVLGCVTILSCLVVLRVGREGNDGTSIGVRGSPSFSSTSTLFSKFDFFVTDTNVFISILFRGALLMQLIFLGIQRVCSRSLTSPLEMALATN
jgi:hypothetical protein